MNDGEVECDVVTNEIAARLGQVHVSIKIIHFFSHAFLVSPKNERSGRFTPIRMNP